MPVREEAAAGPDLSALPAVSAIFMAQKGMDDAWLEGVG